MPPDEDYWGAKATLASNPIGRGRPDVPSEAAGVTEGRGPWGGAPTP
jgi:hypothetical protein